MAVLVRYSCGTWKSMSCGLHGVSAQGPPKVGNRFTWWPGEQVAR